MKLNNKTVISSGQIFAVLLLMRSFTLMTYVPMTENGTGNAVQPAAIFVSCMLQALLVIPIIMLNSELPSASVCGIAEKRSRIFGIISRVIYGVFFLCAAANSVLGYCEFSQKLFFRTSGRIGFAVIMIITAGCCAYLGIEGIARSSSVMLTVFLILTALMTAFAFRNTDISEGLQKGVIFGSEFSRAVRGDIARSSELAAAAFLMKYSEKGIRRPLYAALTGKLILLVFVSYSISVIAGNYAYITDFPFMSLSAFSDAVLFGRADAVFMSVWTISGILSAGVYVFIASDILSELLPVFQKKRMLSCLCVCAAVFALLLPTVMGSEYSSDMLRNICGAGSVCVLTFLIPTLIIVSKEERT